MKRLILAASLLSLAIPAFAQISDKQAEDAYLYGYSIDKSKLYSVDIQTTRSYLWTSLRLPRALNGDVRAHPLRSSLLGA